MAGSLSGTGKALHSIPSTANSKRGLKMAREIKVLVVLMIRVLSWDLRGREREATPEVDL